SKANIRHEIYSLIYCKDNGVLLNSEELVSIAAHHGKLSIRHEDKWKVWSNKDGEELWKLFNKLSLEIERKDFKEWIITSYRYDSPRSILQFADKRASAKELRESVPDYINFQYSFNPVWEKRPVQKLAEENAGDDL